MRRAVQSYCFMLLSLVVLLAGCASAPSTSHTAATATVTQIPTPPGLLMFSSVGKRVFDKAGNMTENLTTTLTDLNPQTGAILWKSPAYNGTAIQKPVIIGAHAIFAIGAGPIKGFTAQPGTVSIYAADLATGAITTLSTLNAVYSNGGSTYGLQMTKLNATMVALNYLTFQSAATFTGNLLAFTTNPDAPVWRASAPAETFLRAPTVVGDEIESLAYHATTKTYSVISFKGTDGSIVRDTPLPGVGAVAGSVIADGKLILARSASVTASLDMKWWRIPYKMDP